ncbi:MAG: hypothetical protein A2542_03155 [Parcubacteria group bacterium RIFOXYD2_FULL_52_8]|nr:MAG: hypothetical protein A2542_03155 [Parcubacteria group bacterium RIFOXYD2_FULL_52_8]
MLLTIVIASYNRKEVLRQLLDGLKQQTDPVFEVVVAVDGSTDGTQAMLTECAKSSSFPLRWVDTGLTSEYALAVARNMGIRAAQGEAVVILDDDSFPVPEFVAEHKKSVRRNTLTGGSRESIDPSDTELKDKMRAYLETYGDCQPQKFKPVPKYKYVVENNTCMFKEDWLRSGLFNESIREYGRIGQEFNHELIKRGFLYQFNPRAKIIHHTEFKQNQLYKRATSTRMNRAKQLLRKRLPALYRFLQTVKNKVEYR